MKKEYKYHYVYRITNIITDYHYYGSKSCNELPKDNIGKKYFSTSGNKLFIQDQKNNPLDYKYKVIKIFETCREDAIELEIILHKKFDVKNHPKFINKANQTSKLFDITGTNQQKGFVAIWDLRTETIKKVPVSEYKNNDDYVSLHKDKISVLDIRDGMTKSISTDLYYMYDYYVSAVSGTTVVQDIRDNLIKRVSIADYMKHDYYVSIMKDKVTIIDIRDNKLKKVSRYDYKKYDHYISPTHDTVSVVDARTGATKRVSIAEFNKYDYYNSTSSGTYLVIDTRTGKTKRVSISDYKKYDYYVSILSKKYKIFDANDNLVYNVYGSFIDFCKENKLPIDALKNSHRNNGKRIYTTLGSNEKRLNDNGMIKYKGWYAIRAE